MKSDVEVFKESLEEFMADAYLHFPSNPDERMGLLLNVFGNRAGQILLGHALGRKPKSMYLVHQLVFEEAGNLPKTDDITHRLLAPARLAEVKIPKEGFFENIFYLLTFEGARYGAPAACFTMDFEDTSGIRIADAFGESSKVTDRTSHNRFRILKVLYESRGPKRKAHLQYDTKLSPYQLDTALKALSQEGFVKIDEAEVDEWITTEVAWKGRGMPKNEREKRVALLIKGKGQVSITDLMVQSAYGREQMYEILRSLHGQGYLIYARKFHNDKKIEAALTDKGKEIVDNYCRPLYMHLSGTRFPAFSEHEERVRLYSERTLDRLIREGGHTSKQRLAINELRSSQL